MINNESSTELTAEELQTVTNLIANNGTEGVEDIRFYAESGDDVYAVIDSTHYVDHLTTVAGTERFVYVKMLYGPDSGSTHFISEAKVFTKQFEATSYLCMQAAEEERGYGGDYRPGTDDRPAPVQYHGINVDFDHCPAEGGESVVVSMPTGETFQLWAKGEETQRPVVYGFRNAEMRDAGDPSYEIHCEGEA